RCEIADLLDHGRLMARLAVVDSAGFSRPQDRLAREIHRPSTDPRDQRMRPSILISYDGRNVLVDTTPDFRTQALRAQIARIMKNWTINGETITLTRLPIGLGDELKTKYGNNFKKVLMANEIGDHILSLDEKKLSAGGIFIEAGGPEMLSLNMISGTWTGFEDPHT
ncbi:hypothetical protein B4Q13_25605, partial [Lacticaseibacillus rhamnosus]